MKNKGVISLLSEYFMKQDRNYVCKLAAGLMIDINRIAHYADLPEKERDCLNLRIKHNSNQLARFLTDGSGEHMEVTTLNSDDL